MAITTWYEAKRREDSDECFAEFLQDPLVNILVSLVPASNPPEILPKVLRAAFDRGMTFGLTR